jgi:perosamine synthetase
MTALAGMVDRASPWRPQSLLPFEASEHDAGAALRCLQDDPVGHGCVDAFEAGLARATGLPHAVAVSSGTAALEVALKVVGVRPGDEVLVPAMTFAGAASAVLHVGATPRFIDCHYDPLGKVVSFKLDRHLRGLPAAARGKVKALVAVDLLGQPSVDGHLKVLCDEFGIAIVEDAAQALGSVGIGRFAKVATLSFNNNKIITTTSGGAVLTHDAELAARARHMSTTSKKPHEHHYDYDGVGHNYRLSNVLCSLGVAQLDRLEARVCRKMALHARYAAVAGMVPGATIVRHASGSNCWLNAVLLEPSRDAAKRRDAALGALTAAGIGCRAMFTPLHMVEPYEGFPRMPNLEVAEDIFNRAICLPSGVEP